ncbi:metal transporter Nramp2 [Artemisia annua]|uniref:Metal transporter Nramp2 n=1 Tax=Artemisia annua TaxID=35608 RepID=A0A2U1M4W4_ARTAN|nr:metal transporter Nramp2 [Artemisia annua]
MGDAPSNKDKTTDVDYEIDHLLSSDEELDQISYDSYQLIDVEISHENIKTIDNLTLAPLPPFSWKMLWKYTGPGFLMSIAFLDPGNLEGDLQAGAVSGYSLLWLLLWSTLMGLLIQLLSGRIGVVTGRHMAKICRDEYPYWAILLLWFMAEIALIAADIQEVIGSAIAIKILSNGDVPLWAGVLITALDCFIFLFLENYGVRKLEAAFACFISIMGLSFSWMFFDTNPSGKELLLGLLIPKVGSKTVWKAVGLLGGIITPHNVFLHSAVVQSREIDTKKKGYYLQERYGDGFFPILYIWGIGLLAAGQSSTFTGTYTGQFIMEGFLDLPMRKWLRTLINRSCAIVPTMIVAVWFTRSEDLLDVLNQWLNILQGIQIPFALIPLLKLVASERLMGAFRIKQTMKLIAWFVAGLAIMVNGCILIQFFISEVKGFTIRLMVSILNTAYIAFIWYLMVHET